MTGTRPNFFIVGAPKCGTTALAHYLGEHPEVFMCEPKEPHYFAEDLPGRRLVRDLPDYLALFEAGGDRRIVGEASVHYLFSEVAIANIRAFNPDARLVAMLRNPVEMVPALHGEFLHGLNEDVTDFERAWALQASRARGLNLPPFGKDPALLQYRAVGAYAGQVARLLRQFPERQVKIILYDDFRQDTRAVYQAVLEFLGLPDDGRRTFDIINASHAFRLRRLGVLIGRKPRLLRRSWAAAKSLFGLDERAGQAIGDWFFEVNSVQRPRPPLSAPMRATLASAFADDIARLQGLIGRDLGHWLAPGRG